MKNLIFSLIVMSSLAMTSCTFDILPSRSGSKKNPNLTLWQSYATNVYKIDQSSSLSQFSPENQNLIYHLTVVNGKVELFIDTNIYLFDPAIFQNFYSIEEMFAIIADANLDRPYQFEVEYDSVYGYPTYLFYDSSADKDFDFFYIETNLTELDAQKPYSYDQRKKWEALEITTYTLEQKGSFSYSFYGAILKVQENIIESGINLYDSSILTLQEARGYHTVNDLFHVIDQSFALENYKEIFVQYDSQMHYPNSVSFDGFSEYNDVLIITTKVKL